MASADSLNVEAQFTEPGTEILSIWFVELFNYPIDRRAVALVAPAICRRHEVLPIGVENERLVLAMADPGNVVAMDDVRAAARMQVEVVAAERSDLLDAIDRLLRADDELSNLTNALVEKNAPADTLDSGSMDSADREVPIVRFVNLLIRQAISYKVGERVWMKAREDAQTRLGVNFNMKKFHTYALKIGPMGLDPFAAEMANWDGN